MKRTKLFFRIVVIAIIFILSGTCSAYAASKKLPGKSTFTLKNEDTSIAIKWKSAKRATKYVVYRKNFFGIYTKIATTKKLSYKDKSVGRDYKTYTYRVAAVNKYGKTIYGTKKIEHKHVHTYSKKNVKAASWFVCGSYDLVCSYCGKTKTQMVHPTGIGKFSLNTFKNSLTKALTYELKVPGYKKYKRDELSPVNSIDTEGYWKCEDGIYRDYSAKEDGTATIILTGDLMCQGWQERAALKKYGKYQFKDSFTYVKKILSSADFTVGNLECTTYDGASYTKETVNVDDKPHCNVPSTFIGAVRNAGFDLVVNANNHNCDTGIKGLFTTLAHIEQYGLIHTGTFRNKSEKRYVIAEIDGIKVGFLSYATYYNTKETYWSETGQNILLNTYSEEKVKRDVKAAKAAGAEYVIGYIHAGTQYSYTVNEKQLTICQQMADAGVDYILGSHPHVLQEYDILTSSSGKKVPVVYSMGNFLSGMKDAGIGRTSSIILQIKLKRDTDGNVYLADEGYIPVVTCRSFNGNNYADVPLTTPYNTTGLKGDTVETEESLKEKYDKIVSVIGSKIDVLGTFAQ